MNKQQTLKDIKQSVNEVKLIKAGKLKGIPAKDLLNELFSPPPTKDIDIIAEAFEQTSEYNKSFITSLKKGLKRSSLSK